MKRLRIGLVWVCILVVVVILGAVRWVPLLMEHGQYIAKVGPPASSVARLLTALLLKGQNGELSLVPDWKFWEYSCYIGLGGLLFLLIGVGWGVRIRPMWPWLLMMFCALGVTLQGPLFGWLRQYPLWRTERCPSRYVIFIVFFATVTAARGWQDLWTRLPVLWRIGGVVAVFLYLTWDLSRQAAGWIPA